MEDHRQAQLDALYFAMCEHDRGNAHRIQHFTKVHGFAARIGRAEGLDEETRFVLEAAAIVHDIGIRPAEEKYGRHDGPLQEREGAPLAYALLKAHGFTEAQAARVSALVGRHHTYTNIDGPDCQILIEADFLVNLHEHGDNEEAVRAARQNIFRTPTGIGLLKTMFGFA